MFSCGLFGVLGCRVERCNIHLHSLGTFEAAKLRQKREYVRVANRKYLPTGTTSSRYIWCIWGVVSPPTCSSQNRRFVVPLLRRGPVRPKNATYKKNASLCLELYLGIWARWHVGTAFEVGLGTWSRLPLACLAHTPKWPNHNRVYRYTPSILLFKAE